MSTKTIKLQSPITLGDQTFHELVLREPVLREIAKSAEYENVAEADAIIIAEVAKMPLAAVMMMGARDYLEARRYLANFWNYGEAGDGKNSSQT